MNRFICCVLFLVFCSAVFPQKVYFIYLQSESEQSFYVKMNEKTYSSAPSGYLILSKLKDSTYNLMVGFPQNKWPEQRFSIVVKAKDQGFLLKNFGEKGWGLFDLQTMGIQMSAENNTKNKAIKTELKEVSLFTEILSKAANDPSLREKHVVALIKKGETTITAQPAVVKQETTTSKGRPVVVHDTSVLLAKKDESPSFVKEEVPKSEGSLAGASEKEIPNKEEKKTVSVQEYKRSVVVRKSESSTLEGFGLTFVDMYADGKKDTIQIIIPNPISQLVKPGEQPVEEKKFLDIAERPNEKESTEAKGIADNNCSSVATETDFLRLRKKMAGQKTEESMINETKKGFKTKCFTVEQIRNLGNLFLNEAAKFQFFEIAYPYSSDKTNFTVLQNELKETYFIHRFQSLVKTGSL